MSLLDDAKPEVEKYEKLIRNAEVARASVALFLLLDKQPPLMKDTLQIAIVKEVKECRKFVDAKKHLPSVLLAHVSEILWGS